MLSHASNHLSFIESIKNKIQLITLTEYENDMQAYLRFLGDTLRIISSIGAVDTAHNNRIPHIFMQLRTTTIPVFQQTIFLLTFTDIITKGRYSPSKVLE